MTRVRIAAGALLLAAFALVGGGQAASASEGSVPVEVTMYTTAKDGLVAKLNDVFGIGGKGSGIDFDDTTTAGPISRVFAWTPDFLAGRATDDPAERLNEWVTAISIDDKVVGFATIWINDATVEPELATFDRGVELGTALLTVPADAALIRDDLGGAWFTLAGTDLTPLDPGTTGIDAVTPLASYQKVLTDERPADLSPGSPNQGLVFGGITLGAVVVLVVVALVLLARRRTRTADAAAAPVPLAPVAPAEVPTPPDVPVGSLPPTLKPVARKPAAPAVLAEPETPAAPARPSAAKRTTPSAPKPAAPKQPATAKPVAAKKPAAPKKPTTAAD